LWFEEDDEDSLEIIKEYGLEVWQAKELQVSRSSARSTTSSASSRPTRGSPPTSSPASSTR